mgnify:CR=1 FL=1
MARSHRRESFFSRRSTSRSVLASSISLSKSLLRISSLRSLFEDFLELTHSLAMMTRPLAGHYLPSYHLVRGKATAPSRLPPFPLTTFDPRQDPACRPKFDTAHAHLPKRLV